MNNVINLHDWDVLCVLRDKRGKGLELAIDKHSATIRLTGTNELTGKDFVVELSPLRALWIGTTIHKYVSLFSKYRPTDHPGWF